MSARTELRVVANVQSLPGRQGWRGLLARWHTRLMTWRRPHRVMLTATVASPVQGAAMEAATQAFEAWAAQHEGAAVELCLSSHCLLMLADDGGVEPPSASGAKALRARAVERWTHYLDLPAEAFDTEWLVQTSQDMGRSPVAVVCAVPKALCDSLLEVARRHGVKLLAIEPWWADSLQQAWQGLPQPAAAQQTEAWQRHWEWAWREGAWQTQARVTAEPGRWVLRSLAFLPDTAAFEPPDPVAVPDEVFEAPAPAPALAAVVPMAPPRSSASAWSSLLTGKARIDWAESLNFAGPRVRTSFWSWALLALGAIAVVHALELAGQVDQAREAAQAEWSRLQAHAKPRARAHEDASAPSTSPPAAPVPALQADAWRSAAQLAAWLGHPWAAALDHADATAHRRGIALTRFQLDLGAWGTRADQALGWRLQAAVPDDAVALAWVQDLGPQAELQRRDALAQPVPSERGTLAWRIDVNGAGGAP